MHISAYICDTALAPVRCRVSQVFPLESKNRTYNYIITYRIVNGDCTYSFERFGPILRTKNVCLGVNGNPVSAFVLRCVIDADPLYLSEFLSWSRQEFRSASRSDYVIPRSRTAMKQHTAFLKAGPTIWNDFRFELHSLPRDLSDSFYGHSFCPGQGWERLWVVPMKQRPINPLDRIHLLSSADQWTLAYSN